MRKLYRTLFLVLLVCVVGTAVFLVLSPDRVPVHYNAAGEADRIGNKFENLIFPGFSLGMAAFFLLMARCQRKQGRETNEKILLYAGICTLVFFTLMGFYFMWKAMRYDPTARPSSIDDVNKFMNIGTGALLVILGNIMPKVRRNGVFGLRTKWSLSSDAVWQKSQRYGGITSVIAGFVLIISALFVPGLWNFAVLMAVLAVWCVLCAVASYRYYKADQDGEAKRETKYGK